MKILITVFMIMATTIIHASGMLLAIHLRNIKIRWQDAYPNMNSIFRTSTIVFVMFLVSLVEVCAWALSYLAVGAIEGLEKAVYFSMVTYTTLGYGDVLLDENWRLLASFEAAIGIIMFGWTTAIVMHTIRHVFFDKN